MDRQSAEIQFKKLEKALRLASSGSNWLLFDPIDPKLLEDLQGITPDDSPLKVAPDLIKQNSIFPEKSTVQTPINLEGPQIEKSPIVENLNPAESNNLDSLRFRLRNCDRCQLCSGRRTIVFGQGNLNADLVFIGEAPGEEEDRRGLVFIGKAGKLLTQIIHSIGLNRKDVYICNVIKCRPPGNRNPNTDEIAQCSPFLFKQIEILKPKLIVTMGNIATKTLLPHATGIMKMRGRMTRFNNIPLIPTFHPSYLLRNQSALSAVWNDMRQIRQFLFKSSANPSTENHPQVGSSLQDDQ